MATTTVSWFLVENACRDLEHIADHLGQVILEVSEAGLADDLEKEVDIAQGNALQLLEQLQTLHTKAMALTTGATS